MVGPPIVVPPPAPGVVVVVTGKSDQDQDQDVVLPTLEITTVGENP